MSYHTLSPKPLNVGLKLWLKRGGHIGLGLGAFAPVLAMANPTGGHVVAGSATITTPSANGTVVSQTSQNAIINWQQFNIGSGQYVQFLQPSSSSVVLNRVIGGGGSSILGNLTGNGQIFLVNTNGVFFGKGASVDAQGFLASTLDITDSNFLNHNFVFNKSGSDAQIVNQGNITAHQGGYVVLAGDYAENDGVIAAQSGHVVLASGAKSTLTLNGNSLVSYAVNQATLAQLAGVDNAGKLQADGGAILMTADVANLLKATVVNNSGLVEARAISKAGGTIQLLATGGNIINAGTLNAAAMKAGLQGGDITLKGDARTTLTNTSKIYATGEGAKGGSVEVSGNTISLRGAMTLGKGGNLLLDPAHLELVTTAGTGEAGAGTGSTDGKAFSTVGVDFIQTQLNAGAAVAISAHSFINASGSVHNITATGTGNLKFKTAPNGTVDLFGVDIKIGGTLTASMGYADFGHLQAAAIDINAGSDVDFAGAVKNIHGVITNQSAVATAGHVQINAPHITSDSEFGSGGLALSAKQGVNLNGHVDIGGNLTLAGKTIDMNGTISAANVTAVTSNGYAFFENINATGTVSVTANLGASHSGSSLHIGNVDAKGLTLTNNGGFISAGGIHDASGDVVMTATGGKVKTDGVNGVNVTLTATHGNVSVGYANATGVLTLAASGEAGVNVSDSSLRGTKGIKITGGHLNHANSGIFVISASSGNIVIGTGIGNSAEGLNGDLIIDAGGHTVKLGHSAFVNGDLDINAKSLAYTGTGTDFTLSAHGDLNLDAAIGTVATPVNYSVSLNDTGGLIRVEKSIFTAGSVDVTQTHSASGAPLQGALFQGSFNGPITVSAGKSITVTAANIGIGNAIGSSQEVGAVSLLATKDIILTANGTGSHSGNITIRAGFAAANNSVGRKTSMLVQAGARLDLQAQSISIQGGTAEALASGSKGVHNAKAVADVTLKAGTDLSISGSQLKIQGGKAVAEASGGNGVTLNATADASVNITAGKALFIVTDNSGAHLGISGGYGSVVVGAGKKGTAAATVTAGVNLKAGTDLHINAASVDLHAGTMIAHAGASSSAAVNAKGTGGITLTAGHDIDVSAGKFQVSAGYGSASVGASSAKAVTATALATADVNFKAGGSINVLASDIFLGGTSQRQAFAGLHAVPGVSHGSVVSAALTAKADVSVNFAAAKAITLSAGFQVGISAGYGVAFGSLAGKNDVGNIAVNSGVSLKAGTGVNVNQTLNVASAGVFLGSSGRPSFHVGPVLLLAGSGAKLTGAIHQDISIDAGGGITLSGRTVSVSAGKDLAGTSSAPHAAVAIPFGSSEIHGGSVKLTDTANVNFTAVGAVSLTASGSHSTDGVLGVHGGSGLARGASVVARDGGQANADFEAAVNIKAGGAFTAHGQQGVLIVGGANAGAQLHSGSSRAMSAVASSEGYGATKSLATINSGINITASTVTVSGGDFAAIGAGSYGGSAASVATKGSKATASLTINSGVAIKATGAFKMSAGFSDNLFGGRRAGIFDGASADGGKAAITVDAATSIKAGSVLLHNNSGGKQSISGGRSAGLFGGAFASLGGSANRTVDATVSIVTPGAFAMTGADKVLLVADSGAGAVNRASNSGGLKVTDTLSNGITISAKSVTLSASNSIELFAAGRADDEAQVIAKGGTATLNTNAGISLTAVNGITMNVTGSGGSSGTNRRIVLAGGSSVAKGASVNAAHGGTAALNVMEGVTLTAGGVITLKNKGSAATSTTFTGTASGTGSSISNTHVATHGIFVVAGSRLGAPSGSNLTHVEAGLGGGTATLNGNVSVNIKAGGAFSMDAGSGQAIVAGGSSAGLGLRLSAVASGKATANLAQDVNLTAASVTIGGGSAILAGGGAQDGGFESIAASHGGVATVNVESTLKVTTSGAFDLSAATLTITSGRGSPSAGIGSGSMGIGATVSARGGAQATLNANGGVAIKAASVSLTASTGFAHIAAGSGDAAFADVSAGGKGDKANLNVNDALSITATVGSITIVTNGTPSISNSHLGAIGISGGRSEGVGAAVLALNTGATAGLHVDGSVTLTAKKAVSASAGGSLFVQAGANSASSAELLMASGKGASATATELSGVSIKAGTALTLGAAFSMDIAAGLGHSASANAQNGAAVTYTQDGSVTLKAVTKATIGAGGNVFVQGGAFNRLAGNAFVQPSSSGHSNASSVASPNRPGGKTVGTMTDTVTITAGSDVDLGAGSNLVVEAGAGNQAFVGAERVGGGFLGQHWAGGSANLAMNTSVTVTAGHNLNLVAGGAGTGSLQVLGMGGSAGTNQANVNGGSSIAVAKVSLIGNATLTAKNDIIIDANGDASIVGGSLGNIRDDHAAGHVTILGSADANLSAGHDVVLDDITGSLTVAGINVNSSHQGSILADAHGDSGFASINAHADAGITAVNSIRTVTALGGNLNVVGGQFVHAVTLGYGTNEQATATADASLKAGNSVTISATGDLTVAGGLFNSAGITNTFSNGGSASGVRTATLKTRADITAVGKVSLTIGGDAVIAGGDSLTATTSLSDDAFMTGTAAADAGVSIKGSNVTLNVTGDLLVRGGSGATARAVAVGGSLHAIATASADAVIASKANVVINAGSASFVGGSGGKGSVVNLFSDNFASGNAHADVSVTAVKAITLTTTHDLKVAGGPGAENSALVVAGLVGGIIGSHSIGALSGGAFATVTGKVNFTAGTALHVTAGGNIGISGGSRGGSGAIITAAQGSSGTNGRNNVAALVVDTSVVMKGATVSLTANGGGTAEGAVNVTTYGVPASGSPVFTDATGPNESAGWSIDQSVSITGTTVTINGTLNKNAASSSSGIVASGITITGHAVPGLRTMALHPLALGVTHDAIQVAPMGTALSFGGVQLMPGTNVTPAAQPAAGIDTSGITLPAPAVTGLDTLQVQGLVLNLVTVMDSTSQSKPEEGTLYAPSLAAGYAVSFPSSCTTLVLDQEGRRCSAGGK